MIRPHSLDAPTIERLRQLVAATYTGRDDLYIVADSLGDGELAAICRKLADDMAGKSAFLEQVIAMHGAQPAAKEGIRSALGEEIMTFLRQKGRDKAILSAAKGEQGKLRERYDATIAATGDPETHAILQRQKEDVEFGERVLGRIAPEDSGEQLPQEHGERQAEPPSASD